MQPRYKKGDRIDGRYLIHQVLMGGMGEVYLCIETEHNAPIALKTFQQQKYRKKLQQGFDSELKHWIALERHPNIVQCFHMEILDNHPFMALEWVVGDTYRGTSLRNWLQGGSIRLQKALDFIIDICRGLVHADQKSPGIVHRDLKPDNVLISQDHVAKITDFGLATIDSTASEIAGTPYYMPPEQWRGEIVDVRADIYAVGCILYESLTHTVPYQGTTIADLRQKHLNAPIPQLPAHYPATINTWVTRCLAKKLDDRFGSAVDMLREVETFYRQYFGREPRKLVIEEELIAEVYADRAGVYHYLKSYEQALAGYNRALEQLPDDARIYFNRGNTYRDMEKYEQALEDYNRALKLNPNYLKVYAARARVFTVLKRYDEALTDINKAIEMDDTLSEVYLIRGDIYDEINNYTQALADYNKAIELNAYVAEFYNNRGLIYTKLERFQDAIADFVRAIECDNEYELAYRNRALTYHRMGKYEQALADFKQVIELDPEHIEAYVGRGALYMDMGNFRQALSDYDYALNLQPDNTIALVDRGRIYAQSNQPDKAIADIQRVIDLEPENARAHFGMGIACAQMEEFVKALHYAEKAVQLGEAKAQDLVAQIKEVVEASIPDDFEYAMNAFQTVTSAEDMKRAVEQYPIMVDPHFIAVLEDMLQHGVPSAYRSNFENRLHILYNIANDRIEDAIPEFARTQSIQDMRQVVAKYPVIKHTGFVQLIEHSIPEMEVDDQKAFHERLRWLNQIISEVSI